MKKKLLRFFRRRLRLGVIRAKDLRPGDVLVIHARVSLTRQQTDTIIKTIEQVFPGHVCCVLQKNLELSRVRIEE